MAELTSIQALIEIWWKEQRPEGDNSSAPSDLPIYRELLDFTQERLKETQIITGKTGDGGTSYMAVGPAGNEAPYHVVPTDDPPIYEAQSAEQKKEPKRATQASGVRTKSDKSVPHTLLPVNICFMCGGFYDYVGRNGSNTYGVLGHKPDAVAYELHMTSAGLISGTSKDSCGKATIDGTIDCETGIVELVKRYGWCNLWAEWNYQGRLEEIGGNAVILGRWESGRFAMWLDTKGVDHDTMMESMIRVLNARDVQSRLGGY